jgi:tetratricopeptide (TPR) repeat protein
MAANQPVMAAEMLERAGQIGEAAAAFEKAGSLVRAAVLYKVVAALPDAARCLEASEQPAEAAACHEQLGNYEKAAELLLQIGNASEAGKALLQAGNHDAALRAFQQVASADAGYHHACRQIGIILLEQGHTALAIRKLEEGLAGAMAESDTLDGYYALGYANQEVGQLDAAIAAFEVILGHDLEFRDTLDRCRQVRGQAEAAKQSEAMDQVSTATMNEPITEPANSASTPAEDRANDTDGEDEAPLLDDARLASPDRDD